MSSLNPDVKRTVAVLAAIRREISERPEPRSPQETKKRKTAA